MVLDDDEQLLALYHEVLVEAGYEVTLVKDGVEGLERLGERPDAFVVDLMMPRIDGCEFIKRLRLMTEFRSTPAHVVSAAAPKSWSQAACGADGFLAKPFEIEALLEQLSTLTGHAG